MAVCVGSCAFRQATAWRSWSSDYLMSLPRLTWLTGTEGQCLLIDLGPWLSARFLKTWINFKKLCSFDTVTELQSERLLSSYAFYFQHPLFFVETFPIM